jgi:hypothetical protein
VRSGLGLPGFAEKFLAFNAGRQLPCLCSETFGFLVETFWESQNVFETATLHDTTLVAYGS